jgi:hypothetical protein
MRDSPEDGADGARLMVSRGARWTGQSVRHDRTAVGAMRDGLIANVTDPNPLIFMPSFLPSLLTQAMAQSHWSFSHLARDRRLLGFWRSPSTKSQAESGLDSTRCVRP